MRAALVPWLAAGILAGCARTDMMEHIPLDVVVTIVPAATTLVYGGSINFTTAVSGTPYTDVVWSVQEGGGGTVSDEGAYVAPLTAGLYHVVATSAANPAASATASVTVTSPSNRAALACGASAPGTFARYDYLGTGTFTDPYVLCSPAQLLDLMNPASAQAWSKRFVLGADIDLTGYDESSSPPAQPIGSPAVPFTGIFDGLGHAISNLHVGVNASSDFVGLFGYVAGSAAVVRNLRVLAADVQGDFMVGALVGALHLGATVSGCASSGTVSGDDCVGGLVGSVGGDYGTPSVPSSSDVAVVSASSSTATVQAYEEAGGLVGFMMSGSIINSYAGGDVGGAEVLGGLVGVVCAGWLVNTYATGNVTGVDQQTGGLLGVLQSGAAVNCFATGNVSGGDPTTTGRLIGDDSGTVAGSATLSSATCKAAPPGTPCHGPVGGESQAADVSVFGDPSSAVLSAWNFAHVWIAGSTFPTLAAQTFDRDAWGSCALHQSDAPFAGGWGTPEAPFLICTPAQLAAVGANVASWSKMGAYELAGNLDMSGAGPNGFPIGNAATPFTGIFDGAGHSIVNFSLVGSAGDYHGLFGRMGGIIKRVGMPNVMLSGGGSYQGALAGTLQNGTLLDSFATGSISASGQDIGGLVGDLSSATVVSSYFAGTVSGDTAAGGLVGYESEDAVQSSFTSSDVTVTTLGGPIAFNGSTTTESSYDSSRSCIGCTNTDGAACSPTSYFFNPQNAPLTSWDFVTVWQSNFPSSFPTLR